MRKRRLTACCLALGLTAVTVAGCGGGGKAQPAAEPAKESVELTTGAAAENKKADDWSEFVKDGKTVIRVGIEADPGTMDPYTTGEFQRKKCDN